MDATRYKGKRWSAADAHLTTAKKRKNLDIITFSKLLDKSWKLKKSLNTNISNDKINNIYDKAIKNGALGGKISGAGGGGFIYFLCPPEHQKKMIKSINEVQYINCKLTDKGSEIIYER